jgi:PKD repeat protein
MTISPNLSVDFSVDSLVGCAPFTVQFTNQSENAVTNYWDFGDGSGSTQISPAHTYTAPGTYDVGLWVFAGNGSDSVSVFQQIHVNPAPLANFQDFVANPQIGGDTVQFADNSINADSWYWDFDDPSSGSENNSTEQNPFHVFANNGVYDVTLVVTNIYGCADTITRTSAVNVGVEEIAIDQGITVYPNPAQEVLNIVLSSMKNGTAIIEVIDAVGKTVLTESIRVSVGLNKTVLELTQLEAGSYVLLLQTGNEQLTQPFVVSRK